MKHIVVIGAGLGGLATAIRLAYAGAQVTILEKNDHTGGKMDLCRGDGYTFDTGPTLLTMPFVLEQLFKDVGRSMPDYVDLAPVDPICRYRFADGTLLDVSADRDATAAAIARLHPADGPAFHAFLRHGERIYRAASGPFLFSAFGSLPLADLMANLRNLPAVVKIDAFRTLDASVRSYFHDERVRQMMNRFATYNGSSPYRAPATLAIIPFIEFVLGGWYVRGGMYVLAQALERLAKEMGVTVRTGSAVTQIETQGRKVRGVRCAGGEHFSADAVVSNADAMYVHGSLLEVRSQKTARRLSRAEPSLAGFVLLLGVAGDFPALAHHNIFFSRDYRREFEETVDEHRPAEDPTIYVAVSSKSDPEHAPPGHANLFVLVNAPPLNEGIAWKRMGGKYRDLVIHKLEAAGLEGLGGAIRFERVLTPESFADRYNAPRGAIYGTSSNSRLAAFRRPPNRAREYDNLYFVGGSSHPGGGIPLVLSSGAIVAGMVREEVL